MTLTLLSPVQVAAAGMDSPPESRDGAETPLDPFDEHKDDIRAMINDYTSKEIVQELSQRGFQTSQRSLERRL
jgi:hypothetical protein